MARTGRPKTDTAPINLRLPRSVIDTIDDLRREEQDLPTRPEMIRRLIQDAIAERKKR